MIFSVLGLDGWQWGAIAGAFAAASAAALAAQFVARRIIRLRERVGLASIGASAARATGRGIGLGVFAAVGLALLGEFALPEHAHHVAKLVLEGVTIVGAMLFVLGVWEATCDLVSNRANHDTKAERLLVPVTRKLVRFLIVLLGLLVALGTFGVNVTGLLAGLGIGGLVVALAAKDSVENIFGSVTILFDMPFALGDWVRIEKAEGVVEEINLRSTKIRTFEDSVITLPNSNLIKASVENFGARRFRRQRFSLRLAYGEDPAAITALVGAIGSFIEKDLPGVIPDRTYVRINDLSETSIGVLVQCFFEAETLADELAWREQLLSFILRAAREHSVRFVAVPPIPRG